MVGTVGKRPDPAALDFYDRLIDGLSAAGVAPVVTLTHYEMPLSVMEDGGWLVRDTAELFADYATRMASRFADRVAGWVTMNSPFVHAGLGYGLGIEAPGLTLLGGALQVARTQLIGHGLAVQALRAGGATVVGIANAHTRVSPASDSAGDQRAAGLYDALHNRALTDPLFGRDWAADLVDFPGGPNDQLSAADRHLVAAPLDFYGVNYFHPQVVQDDPDNATIPFAFTEPLGDVRVDAFGWPIDPAALTATLTELSRRYPDLPPIWVTENGTQDGGGSQDDDRARYLAEHLDAVVAARRAGVDVRGYFFWSLLDGWEFAEGLSRRFGLVAVDPRTGERTPKASYHAYRRLLTGRRR